MKTILAEKPSVAKEIASILGANQREEGYYTGNGYNVTYAFGHLIELAPIKYYSESLSLKELPIIPNEFHLIPKKDAGAKKQLSVIKNLFKNSDQIINATDAGREGELIFGYIYDYLKCSKPVQRLWISSMTHEAIESGFNHLLPSSEKENLYQSAMARSKADWIIGLNGSIALSKANGSGDLLSVGRVQTATLFIIVKRTLENKNFKPEDYFVVELVHLKNGVEFKSTYPTRFKTKDQAISLVSNLKKHSVIIDLEKKQAKENPPKLFDLTTLQRTANNKEGFSAQKTLDITQSLYEKYKVVTYPRTDSSFLSDDMMDDVFETFTKLSSIIKNTNGLNTILETKSKTPFNNKKVTDHHAIIPTGEIPKNLRQEEQKIFDLILNQFCMAFHTPLVKEVTKVVLENNQENFHSNGSIVLDKGFKTFKTDFDQDNELPQMNKGEELEVKKSDALSKQTTPPALLTEASLLKLMETAGKYLDNEDAELVEAMKEKGIGTPATRASMIEVLLKRGYIVRQKKNLIPSDLGTRLILKLKNVPISSPRLTGNWENKLQLIEKGELATDDFYLELNSFAQTITKDLIAVGKEFGYSSGKNKGIDTPCPKCREKLVKSKKGMIFCTSYFNEDQSKKCGFSIPSEFLKKKLTESTQLELLVKRKTKLIKGFVSKNDKKFDAYLILKEDHSIGMEFPPYKNK